MYYFKMKKQAEKYSQNKGNNDIICLFKTPFFSIYGKKRKVPNEFTKLGDEASNLRNEIFKALKISQIVKWLSKMLK